MIKQLRKKGVRIVDIADELRCSERTVRRKLQQDKPLTGRRKSRGSKLDRYKTDINTMLYVEKIWNAEVIAFNKGFLALAYHYGFEPKACRPRRARTKGKVERMVGYVKHNFFAEHRSFDSFAHLNQLLEQWLAEVADARLLRHFRQTPLKRFSLEQSELQALPPSSFDTRYYDVRIVAWDAYIDVRGHRYSVPNEYCNQHVTIRISMDDELSIYDIKDTLIAQHRLQHGVERWHTIAEHHQALWNAPELAVQTRDLRRYEEAASCN